MIYDLVYIKSDGESIPVGSWEGDIQAVPKNLPGFHVEVYEYCITIKRKELDKAIPTL